MGIAVHICRGNVSYSNVKVFNFNTIKNNCLMYEFQEIPLVMSSWNYANMNELKTKDRYKNILPCK